MNSVLVQYINPALDCKSECITQGYNYCIKNDINSITAGECCQGNDCKNENKFCSNTEGSCCSEEACRNENKFCTNSSMSLNFKHILCQNDKDSCGDQTLLIPQYGTNGIEKTVEISSRNMYILQLVSKG